MNHQDWTPVVVRRSARVAAANAPKSIVPKRSAEAQRLYKLETEEYTKSKMLTSESRQELVQRRLIEKLTQQQLDQRCSFPAHTLRDLESNKRCPTNKELQTLNRVLRCSLKLA